MPRKKQPQKRRRRQHGSGSIYWAQGKQLWIGAKVVGYTESGAVRRVTVSSATAGEAGEAEVKRKLEDKIREIHAKGPDRARTSRATVRSWSITWLASAVHRMRPKSYLNAESNLRRWVIPTIGHVRLSDLTPEDIRSVEAAVRAAGRAGSTALRVHIVLVEMLKAATTDGGHDVPQRIFLLKNPTKARADRDAIPLPDALLMFREAQRERDFGSKCAAVFLQGLRQGEKLGLTWPLIDFGREVANVSWQLQALPYRHGCERPPNGRWECGRRFAGDCPDRQLQIPDEYEFIQLSGAMCLVRPKTRSGERPLPLVPWMLAALEKWQSESEPNPYGLVWPRADGEPQTSRNDAEEWKLLQQKVGVANPDGRPYFLHEGRHTTATLLHQLRVPDKVRQDILGHAGLSSTAIYTHTSLEDTRAALAELAGVFELTAQ